MSDVIQVFEHTALPVGGLFTSTLFDRLVQYNERNGNRFFNVGHNRIHFRNYVGVIQIGNLTIEILPKADKTPESPAQKQKWQRALIDMLRQSGFIRLASVSDARLRLRSCSLLDIYFESFLTEVERPRSPWAGTQVSPNPRESVCPKGAHPFSKATFPESNPP